MQFYRGLQAVYRRRAASKGKTQPSKLCTVISYLWTQKAHAGPLNTAFPPLQALTWAGDLHVWTRNTERVQPIGTSIPQAAASASWVRSRLAPLAHTSTCKQTHLCAHAFATEQRDTYNSTLEHVNKQTYPSISHSLSCRATPAI